MYLDEDYATVMTEPNEKLEFEANENQLGSTVKLGVTEDIMKD